MVPGRASGDVDVRDEYREIRRYWIKNDVGFRVFRALILFWMAASMSLTLGFVFWLAAQF